MTSIHPPPPDVAAVFADYPPPMRRRLLELRALIFSTAAEAEGVGALQERLRWGEPAYLTAETKSGTTIRIGPIRDEPDAYGLFVHCQTTLIETFRDWFPTELRFQGSRCVRFAVADPLPVEVTSACIAAALTYHLAKRRR